MKYKLIGGGSLTMNGVRYKTGDLVESNSRLDRTFKNVFQRIEDEDEVLAKKKVVQVPELEEDEVLAKKKVVQVPELEEDEEEDEEDEDKAPVKKAVKTKRASATKKTVTRQRAVRRRRGQAQK
jgi:hypothetical protein